MNIPSMRSLLLPSLITLSCLSFTLATPCDCYMTSTSDYFTTHNFLDFRAGKPPNFSSFFSILEDPTYKVNTVTNAMSSTNLLFTPTHLSLLTSNPGTGVQHSADIYTAPTILHGSFRLRAQITGAAGAVAGFFTYLDATNEQDVEILTAEAPDRIHYTTHGNDGGAGDGNPTLNTTLSRPWTEMNTYRLDWIPDKASFFANDDPAKVLTTAVPTRACTLDLNLWSAGEGWGGAMAVGESAKMDVLWIEAVYNSTAVPVRGRRGARHGGGGCRNVCRVDGVAKVGTPELVGR